MVMDGLLVSTAVVLKDEPLEKKRKVLRNPRGQRSEKEACEESARLVPYLLTEEQDQPMSKAEAKERRRTRRAQAREHMSCEPGKTVLQSYAVGLATQRRYHFLVAQLTEWNRGSLPTFCKDSMDGLLVEYLDEQFWEGEELHEGTSTLAAILHTWPELGRGDRGSLPRSRQALQGWSKLGPSRARLPLPWLVMAGVCHWMAEEVAASMALVTLLTFVCYLRPGVASRLTEEQFTEPSKKLAKGGARGPQHYWTLNLHPREWEQCSKTGTWDETVEVNDQCELDWISDCLYAKLGRDRPRASRSRGRGRALPACQEDGTPMMEYSHAQWSQAFSLAFKALGVPPNSAAHLYRLRHGGASHDVARRLRSLDEVQKRGAWRSTASVARYAKPGRINEQIRAMEPGVVAELERREAILKTQLRGWLSEAH